MRRCQISIMIFWKRYACLLDSMPASLHASACFLSGPAQDSGCTAYGWCKPESVIVLLNSGRLVCVSAASMLNDGIRLHRPLVNVFRHSSCYQDSICSNIVCRLYSCHIPSPACRELQTYQRVWSERFCVLCVLCRYLKHYAPSHVCWLCTELCTFFNDD